MKILIFSQGSNLIKDTFQILLIPMASLNYSFVFSFLHLESKHRAAVSFYSQKLQFQEIFPLGAEQNYCSICFKGETKTITTCALSQNNLHLKSVLYGFELSAVKKSPIWLPSLICNSTAVLNWRDKGRFCTDGAHYGEG